MLWKAQKKHLAHCLAQRQNSVNTQIYKVVMVLVIIFIFLSAHTQCTAGGCWDSILFFPAALSQPTPAPTASEVSECRAKRRVREAGHTGTSLLNQKLYSRSARGWGPKSEFLTGLVLLLLCSLAVWPNSASFTTVLTSIFLDYELMASITLRAMVLNQV